MLALTQTYCQSSHDHYRIAQMGLSPGVFTKSDPPMADGSRAIQMKKSDVVIPAEEEESSGNEEGGRSARLNKAPPARTDAQISFRSRLISGRFLKLLQRLRLESTVPEAAGIV